MVKYYCDKCGKQLVSEDELNGYYIGSGGAFGRGRKIEKYDSTFDLCSGCFDETFSFLKKEDVNVT